MATFALDCETYPNFFLAVFRDVDCESEHRFHAVDGMCLTREDVSQVQNIVTENRIVTFNARPRMSFTPWHKASSPHATAPRCM